MSRGRVNMPLNLESKLLIMDKDHRPDKYGHAPPTGTYRLTDQRTMHRRQDKTLPLNMQVRPQRATPVRRQPKGTKYKPLWGSYFSWLRMFQKGYTDRKGLITSKRMIRKAEARIERDGKHWGYILHIGKATGWCKAANECFPPHHYSCYLIER